VTEDQIYDAAEREMDLYRNEIARITDQRNRCSETADQLRGQLRAIKAVVEQHALGDTPRAILAQAVLDQMDADL
jgi:hypothetical protein